MMTGEELKDTSFKTRQSSLRFHRLQTPEPVPKFFEIDSQTCFSNTRSSSHQNRMESSFTYNFIMNKTALFSFLLTLTFVSVLLFVAGFMVAYALYSPSNEISSYANLEKKDPTLSRSPQRLSSADKSQQAHKKTPEGILEQKNKDVDNPSLQTQKLLNRNSANSAEQEIIAPSIALPDPTEILNELNESIPSKETIENDLSTFSGSFEQPTSAELLNREEQSPQMEKQISTDEEKLAKTDPIHFVIEFSHTNNEQTAQEMVQEMSSQGLKAEISQTITETGKFNYRIHSPFYKDYNTAYKALNRLPKPFSTWGKIIRFDKKPNTIVERQAYEN